MKHDFQLAELSSRMAGIGAWLDQSASHHLAQHRHLETNTAEAAYWHAGYHQALADAIRLLSASAEQPGIADTSNPFRRVASGEESFLSA